MSRFCLSPAPLTLAVALAMGTLAAAVQAQPVGLAPVTAPVEFSIATQPLGQALNTLARQTRLELIVQPSLVDGKTAPAVAGLLTPRQALDKLLAGSGLMATIDGSVVTVRRVPPTSTDVATLPSVTVVAQAERSATTEHTGSYTTRAVTLGKGDQALKDIPQSISVVTRQLLDEQNITSVYDALASTTGITIQQSPQGGKYIYSRGFDLATVQYDGVPLNRGMYGRASNYSSNMAYVDRVEVLRGAAGLLQGEGNPGGAVNLVRKRPLNSNATTVEARAGSWDRYGAQLDTSRILNEEGSLRARALIDYEDQHSFVDYANRRSATLYGTLE